MPNYPSVYAEGANELLARLAKLKASSTPYWGKMTVSQMLAHLSVSYDMAYGLIKERPNFLMRILLKWIIKPMVISSKPYPKNAKTTAVFLISDERDFQHEMNRLTEYISRVKQDGPKVFDGKESPSFGPMSADEWSDLFYKHADHHLTQFGV